MIEMVWAWIMAHVPAGIKVINGIKLIADTADSVKKLAPAKLEMKEATQSYMTETLDLAKDQSKALDERQMELDTRRDLTESMVKLTVVEAAYNISRFAIMATFILLLFRLFTNMATKLKKENSIPAARTESVIWQSSLPAWSRYRSTLDWSRLPSAVSLFALQTLAKTDGSRRVVNEGFQHFWLPFSPLRVEQGDLSLFSPR
jgi:hypothetical protein